MGAEEAEEQGQITQQVCRGNGRLELGVLPNTKYFSLFATASRLVLESSHPIPSHPTDIWNSTLGGKGTEG
jgi:hypothetical protein